MNVVETLVWADMIKPVWYGIVFLLTIYMITDTWRINKSRELKVRIKEIKEDDK